MFFSSRKSPRIPNFDYTSENYYFITICTHEKRCLFDLGEQKNTVGRIVKEHLDSLSSHYPFVRLDKYVVMPNHIHMILVLESGNKNEVGQIIGQFKSGVSREVVSLLSNAQLWQRSFHDHVIRSQADYERIWCYIEGNPQCWDKDCFFAR